jgi:hypothetical protein
MHELVADVVIKSFTLSDDLTDPYQGKLFH